MPRQATVLAAAAALGLFPGAAQAFCGVYVGSPGEALANQSSEVVLAREGGGPRCRW